MNTPTPVITLEPKERPSAARTETFEDEFLSIEGLSGLRREGAERALQQALSEIEEMTRENRWSDIVSLFHPVEEKAPEIAAHGLDLELRLKVAFALGQVKEFDSSIQVLQVCTEKEPENFAVHSALGYTAYNSLYAARNREIFLSGKSRHDRLELAHLHLRKAQALRPEGVTNYYRQGMLFKQIESKHELAIPLFERAVSNWDALDESEKERRHQERKNFIKALYNLAGALLKAGRPQKAEQALDRCLEEDRESDHISVFFKFFALGKVRYHLNQYPEARDALVFALSRAQGPSDFASELLARTCLALGEPTQAMKAIEQVPEKFRRPYYRWTEADVWCTLKEFDKARRVLLQAQERDQRSKHKTLIRLAKVEYLLGNFHGCATCASNALKFYEEKWGTIFEDGLFWEALGLFRLGRCDDALGRALVLQRHNPRYPRLELLIGKLRAMNHKGS